VFNFEKKVVRFAYHAALPIFGKVALYPFVMWLPVLFFVVLEVKVLFFEWLGG